MSEKTEAEAGAKATAEALDKVVAEAAEGEVDTAEAAAVAEVAALAAETSTTKSVAAARLASVTANETLRAVNAKILSLGLKFKGVYSELVEYVLGDIVTFEGGSFELQVATAEEEPPEKGKSNAQWIFR